MEMRDGEKTERLARELAEMRQRVSELETAEAEYKQTAKALKQRTGEMELLCHASQVLGSTLDMDEVLASVLEEVRGVLGVVASSVWMIDPETDELVCRHATGDSCDVVRGWRLASGEGIVGWTASHGKSVIISDTRVDKRYFKGVEDKTGLTLRSALSIPLKGKQGVLGVLQVVDAKPGRFKPTHMALLEPLAVSAAVAIENARLYEQARQEIAERQKAESALRQLSQELMQEVTKRKDAESALEAANVRLDYLLRRFVPDSLARQLVTGQNLPSLGGEQRVVSVLFADIRGYTLLSEVLKPEELMRVLNRHFAVIGSSIRTYGGTISQYVGDMVMALFNAPEDQPDHAVRAVRAGIDLRGALFELGQQSLEGDLPIVVRFGVGINTGPAVAGYLGFEDRFDYTAVGDTVNTASRLSAAAHSGEVLIGPQTFEAVRGHILTRMLGPIKLKGKSEKTLVYEVLDEVPKNGVGRISK
jgi:class 3 adenylate cyclase/putative methionine-R-sulfoxide reductase with GAF domain